MKKIKFLKSHYAYGYFAGDEANLNNEAATTLINGGFAIPAEEEEAQPEAPADKDAEAADAPKEKPEVKKTVLTNDKTEKR